MIIVFENEVNREKRYLVKEITRYIPDSKVTDFVYGESEKPEINGVDGVIIAGSTAGVYEKNHYPWMDYQMEIIHELVEKEVPTLGICFGHQIINSALGGMVENSGQRRAELVKASFTDDPLFEGLEPIVPVLHSDIVTQKGKNMEVIATTEYYENFSTRHQSALLWTVQFHPEFTKRVKHLGDNWKENGYSFRDCNAHKLFNNFYRIATE